MVIHWPIVSGPPVNNSIARAAISAAPTEKRQANGVGVTVMMALLIADVQAIEVEEQIAREALVGTVVPAAVKLVRVIDLAAREIAAVEVAEIELVAAMWEVPGIGAPSEIVPDTAAVMPAQVAAGVPPALVVRVGDLAEVAAVVAVEVAAEVVAVVAAEVAAVVAAEVAAAVGDSEVIDSHIIQFAAISTSSNYGVTIG